MDRPIGAVCFAIVYLEAAQIKKWDDQSNSKVSFKKHVPDLLQILPPKKQLVFKWLLDEDLGWTPIHGFEIGRMSRTDHFVYGDESNDCSPLWRNFIYGSTKSSASVLSLRKI
jgi:hypothetical protein